MQAVFAALGDYYTWQLALKTYGHESKEAWAAVCRDLCNQMNSAPEPLSLVQRLMLSMYAL